MSKFIARRTLAALTVAAKCIAGVTPSTLLRASLSALAPSEVEGLQQRVERLETLTAASKHLGLGFS
jgi:hypothetical protein